MHTRKSEMGLLTALLLYSLTVTAAQYTKGKKITAILPALVPILRPTLAH